MGIVEKKDLYDVVVVGGGPAGLTAALYLARACYRVLVVEKEKFGGQITITSEVVNYPGTGAVSGTELTEQMRKQAESFGAEFLLADVTQLDLSGDVKRVETTRGTFSSFAVLLATGAYPRTIGFKGEEAFRGHGVAYCATCDGEFFTGMPVFVVGGGFAAAEESVFLTKYASHVTVLVREDDFTCAAATAEAARSNPNITVLTNTEVVEIAGDDVLRTMTYRNNKTGEETHFTPESGTFGVFVFAGYEPSTALVKDMAQLDPHGYIVTERDQSTNVAGLYAAGDVCVKALRQVVTATGDGAIAATEIEKYVSKMQKKTGQKAIPPVRPRMGTVQENTAQEAETETFLTDDMRAQLNTVFARMEKHLVLKLYLDKTPLSKELQNYMEELSMLTEKLTLEVLVDTSMEAHKPCVRVYHADGTWAGMAFHGVPGGHELTSFVLGLYNAAGPGQSLPDDLAARIKAIDKDVHVKILVGLSCTMCPELVTAAQRIASLNPRVTTDVYDLAHYQDLKDKYNVMSVPCFIVNEGKTRFGKKNVEELVNIFTE